MEFNQYLADVKARESFAPPGPYAVSDGVNGVWKVGPGYATWCVLVNGRKELAEFFASARADVPMLLKMIEAAEALAGQLNYRNAFKRVIQGILDESDSQ